MHKQLSENLSILPIDRQHGAPPVDYAPPNYITNLSSCQYTNCTKIFFIFVQNYHLTCIYPLCQVVKITKNNYTFLCILSIDKQSRFLKPIGRLFALNICSNNSFKLSQVRNPEYCKFKVIICRL